MASTAEDVKNETKLTFRAFEDGDYVQENWQEAIFEADHSHKCPTYVHRTPPCQGSCPSGEDIRGWLQIVRGIEKPPADMNWQEYAFRRSTDANPFPAIMGRVCPAPCQDGCNRNEVEDFVGINSVEQFIGDSALQAKLSFEKPDVQVVSINWGPWDGGMVNDGLRREFTKKGIDLIPLKQGAQQLVLELCMFAGKIWQRSVL